MAVSGGNLRMGSFHQTVSGVAMQKYTADRVYGALLRKSPESGH